HKLMLGFGLVVAVVGLLLAGTIYGLTSYGTTIRYFDHRLVDLNYVNKLRNAARELEKTDKTTIHEAAVLVDKVALVRKELVDYQNALKENKTYGKSPEKSWEQTGCIEKLNKLLDGLDSVIRQYT